MKKTWRYWGKLFGVGLGFFYILFVGAYAWITSGMMISPSRHPVCCDTPADFGAEFETVTLQTKDGFNLYGWHIPSTNGAAVILLHGYGGDRASMLAYAKIFHSHGYGVLQYDQRASGESEGETRSWGRLNVWDVEAAIGFLKCRSDLHPKGIGIKPEYHKRVFGLFDKLDPYIEGTGIGLALVKRIIEIHGGEIWVESDGNKGCAFLFTLGTVD